MGGMSNIPVRNVDANAHRLVSKSGTHKVLRQGMGNTAVTSVVHISKLNESS